MRESCSFNRVSKRLYLLRWLAGYGDKRCVE